MSDDATTMSIGRPPPPSPGRGQMFEMKDIEIDGVALRAWKNAPASLRVVLDLSLARSDRDFLVYEDERTTFGSTTGSPRPSPPPPDEYGVEKGDRWHCDAQPSRVGDGLLGCDPRRRRCRPLNAWWTANELEFGLSDSASVVVFADEERLERIRPTWRTCRPCVRSSSPVRTAAAPPTWATGGPAGSDAHRLLPGLRR